MDRGSYSKPRSYLQLTKERSVLSTGVSLDIQNILKGQTHVQQKMPTHTHKKKNLHGVFVDFFYFILFCSGILSYWFSVSILWFPILCFVGLVCVCVFMCVVLLHCLLLMFLFVYFYLPVYFLKRRERRHGVGQMGKWEGYGRMWGRRYRDLNVLYEFQ